jgi:hypothetical protein
MAEVLDKEIAECKEHEAFFANQSNTKRKDYWNHVLVGLQDARAAMTEVDIPDGCKLAVVDMKKGVDFNTEGESYVLLVQEVM